MYGAAIHLAIAGLVFWIVDRARDRVSAAVATIVYLNAPLVARYGHLDLGHSALLFCMLALWCVARAADETASPQAKFRLNAIGAVSFALAELCTWEPVLAVPGIAAYALLARDRRLFRSAILLGIAGTVAVAAVFALYASQSHDFLARILLRIVYRAGFGNPYGGDTSLMASPYLIYELDTVQQGWSIPVYIFDVFILRLSVLGPVAVFGLILALFARAWLWRGTGRVIPIVCVGLGSIYVLWAIVMRSQMEGHEFEARFITPLAALCVGQLVWRLRTMTWPSIADLRRGGGVLAVAVCVAIPAVAMVSRSWDTIDLIRYNREGPVRDIEFPKAIAKITPPDAIVTYPDVTYVPVYYMNRHIVRGIADDKTLAKYRSAIEALCRDCPIYVAVPKGDIDKFSGLDVERNGKPVPPWGWIVPLRTFPPKGVAAPAPAIGKPG